MTEHLKPPENWKTEFLNAIDDYAPTGDASLIEELELTVPILNLALFHICLEHEEANGSKQKSMQDLKKLAHHPTTTFSDTKRRESLAAHVYALLSNPELQIRLIDSLKARFPSGKMTKLLKTRGKYPI